MSYIVLVAMVALRGIIFALQLLAYAMGEGLITARFQPFLPGYYMTGWFKVHEAVSAVQCLMLCANTPSCYYGSYHDRKRTCGLSRKDRTWEEDLVKRVGWKVYVWKECPANDDFIQVGSHEIALCHGPKTQQEATTACSAVGRIVEIESEEMFEEINSVLINLPEAVRVNYYGDFWTAGRYDRESNVWTYPAGQPMPITNDTAIRIVRRNRGECLLLNENHAYKFDRKQCAYQNGFMCEKL